MKNRRQAEDVSGAEYVIKRPLFWPIFLLILFFMTLPLCFWDTPETESVYLSDWIIAWFYSTTGFSIWIPATVIVFVSLAIQAYGYLRFKLVVQAHGFTVTPLLGATHEVAFSSVENVTNARRVSRQGYCIDIEYDGKKIRIPYSLDGEGRYRQTGIAVLLNRLEAHEVHITQLNQPSI